MMTDNYLTNTIFAVLDLETTGLKTHEGHRICEVAVHRSKPGEPLDQGEEFQSLVDPGREISAGARKVNGITREMVREKPSFDEVAEDVLDLLDGAVFVAHNASFDLGFLWSELLSSGRAMPELTVVDTCAIAYNQFSFESNSLDHLAPEIAASSAEHRALEDVRVTKQLLDQFVKDLHKEGVETLPDLIRAQGGPIRPPDEPDEPLFPEELRSALEEERRIKIEYESANGHGTRRWITPRLLAESKSNVYLDAYCHLREDDRQFRLDRIQDILEV
jgi:DNA polymerase III epsilon subunit family exonuclease